MDRRELLKGAALGLPLVGALSACGKAAAPSADQGFIIDPGRQPDEIIPLWPEGPPGDVPEGLNEHLVVRQNAYGLPDHAANEITNPALSVFRPANPTGEVLLLIPGGGYNYVVVEKEGWEGARYFNQFGITCYVMTYRLPQQGWTAGADTPLQDAQRALRVVRHDAAIKDLDTANITIMGFSAGGHVAGSLGLRFDEAVYAPNDEVDQLSARPDRMVLVYPVATMRDPHVHAGSRRNLLGDTQDETAIETYSLETRVRADAPPAFLLHSADDNAVPVQNSLMTFEALRNAGVPAALHVFTHGEHGFGLRGLEGTPLSAWPGLVLDWWRQA